MGEVTHIRQNGKGHPVFAKNPPLPATQNRQGNELWAELTQLAAVMPGTSETILRAAASVAREHGLRAALGFAIGLATARAIGPAGGMHIDIAISDILDLAEQVTPEEQDTPSQPLTLNEALGKKVKDEEGEVIGIVIRRGASEGWVIVEDKEGNPLDYRLDELELA